MNLAPAALLAVLATPLLAQDAQLESARLALLERAFPDPAAATVDAMGPGSREAFLAVLDSDLFLHEAVGPFDVHVMLADGLADTRSAEKVLRDAAKGLKPVVPVMERFFGGEDGLISGRRLPIVLTHANRDEDETAFDEVIAVLEWAEDDYSGWKQGGNALWDGEIRSAVTARTWEVQVFNLAHELARDQGGEFFEHGLGYYTIAHVVANVLNQGAWGLVPPWLAQGLTDELDIAAYDEAWVGGSQWIRQTPGWSRPGWSGFVPQGQSPPAPVTGPPADLAVTVKRGGDSWQHRDFSGERHWAHLVGDRDSEAPASFAFMAETESFLPRDRALARCMLHLLLEVAAPTGQPGLLDRLDRVPSTPNSGMPDSEPLTALISDVLGGVPAVEALEAMPLGELLPHIGQDELRVRLEELGAQPMLELSDHREQALWLYKQPMDRMDWDRRNAIWELILTAEYHQQIFAWKLLGEALDEATNAALAASRKYPTRSRDRGKVAEAFWGALEK